MKKKRVKISIVFIFIMFLLFKGCSKRKDIKNFDLLVINNPVFVYGGEYNGVFLFYVDSKGYVYIDNGKKICIDKYDKNGRYEYSIGKRGNGPGEFQWAPLFCVDRGSNLYTTNGNDIQIFDKKGTFQKSFKISADSKWGGIQNILCVSQDKILITYENSFIYRFVLYDTNTGERKVIKKDEKKYSKKAMLFHNLLARFSPATTVDKDGNIYIADSVDYEISVFDKNGIYKRTFKKEFQSEKIDYERDFTVPEMDSETKLKEVNYGAHLIKAAIKKTGGIYEYYPAIIGINIDNNKILVWSSKRDGDKYIIDIYNKIFKLMDRRSFFNYTMNKVIIKDGFLYIPDIIPAKGKTISRIMGMAYNLGVSEKILKFKLAL